MARRRKPEEIICELLEAEIALAQGGSLANERLGQSCVMAVAGTADRWRDPGLAKALGLPDRHALAASVTVVDQATSMEWPPIMHPLFQNIRNLDCTPAHN